MLIYIIGKIAGNPDYLEQFARAEDAPHREYPCDVINPAKRRPGLLQADYAGLSYDAVTKADAVACLWTVGDSFGAAMERHVANGQGKRMMSVDKNYKVTEVEQ